MLRGKKQCFCFFSFCEEEGVFQNRKQTYPQVPAKTGSYITLSCKGSWEMETFGLEMLGDGTDVGEGGLRMAVGV